MNQLTRITAVLLLAAGCTPNDGSGDDEQGETAGETGTSTDTGGDTDSTESGSGEDVGTDTSTEESGAETAGETDTGVPNDCELGEYIEWPPPGPVDLDSSGLVLHRVGSPDAFHDLSASFYIPNELDFGLLCVDPLAEADGVDSCTVFYTEGSGLGEPPLDGGFTELPADAATFDVGDGPVALEAYDAGLAPTRWSAALPDPPDGVPWGGVASLAVDFQDLGAFDLDLDVPGALLPLNHDLGVTALTSAELASWTWTTPGGAEPVELDVTLAATPDGGWSEWVTIRCYVEDDGAFEIPSEYIDFARDHIGPQMYTATTVTRMTRGSAPLADKQLHWQSSVGARLTAEIVD
jgi:hypothetical protein